MADEPIPQPAFATEKKLTTPRQSVETLTFASPNQIADMDVERIRLFFELQEKQREDEFNRQLRLLQEQARLNLQSEARADRNRKLSHRERMETRNLYFKMFVATASLVMGTIFVLKGHGDMGSLLLGGALSTITSSVVGLMKASRST
jgi:hypothetical protein